MSELKRRYLFVLFLPMHRQTTLFFSISTFQSDRTQQQSNSKQIYKIIILINNNLIIMGVYIIIIIIICMKTLLHIKL